MTKDESKMIRIHNSTKEKLDNLKIYESQTYNDCINHIIVSNRALERDKEFLKILLMKNTK